MSANLNIWLDRPNKCYKPGDNVNGTVSLEVKTEGRHEGITILLEGILSIQPPLKTAGLLETFVSAPKPLTICSVTGEVSSAGKLKAGISQYKFSLVLNPLPNKSLHETFHGQCIFVQYTLKCDVKRSLLEKNLMKTVELLVTIPKTDPASQIYPISQNFICAPETLSNVRERVRTPAFLIKGNLDSKEFSLHKAVTGSFVVVNTKQAIKSVDLHLMRIETVKDANIQETSEIQVIQICSEDPPRNASIPIHIMLPRFLSCCTIMRQNFSIEFELNFVITFDNDQKATETCPIVIV